MNKGSSISSWFELGLTSPAEEYCKRNDDLKQNTRKSQMAKKKMEFDYSFNLESI